MANTFTNFYPTLWSDDAYFELVRQTVALQVVNLTWVDPGGPAEAVRIPKFSYDETAITDVSSLADTPTNASESTLVLNLDRHKGFFFQIEYIEQDKASVPLGESILRQRVAGLAGVVDADVLSTASGFTELLSGVSLTKAACISAIEILNRKHVPQQNRVLLVGPTCYSDLLGIDDFMRADSIAGNDANRTGFVGMVLGFEVFLTTNLPTGQSVDALFMHRAGIALAMLKAVDVRVFDQPRHFATGWSGRTAWGRTIIDDDLGVKFNRI